MMHQAEPLPVVDSTTEFRFHIVKSRYDVWLTLEVFSSDGLMVCGLRNLEGKINLPPKAMRAAMIEELAIIERTCKESGVSEMRHAGDDRGWCLPGYEPAPDLPMKHARRKRL